MTRRANDEGSIWQRKDGRWSGAYFVPNGSGGRVRRYVYGTTRQEVHHKLVEIIGKVQRGVPVARTTVTVAAYLEEWLEQIARPRLRPMTIQGYGINIRKHIVPRIGRKKLDKLNPRDVRLMLDDLRASGLSQRSVQYAHATLRTALEHAVREELLSRNVARLVQVGTPDRKEQTSLSVDEAKRLLKAARNDRLYAAYLITLLLGLRRGEVLGLRWEDVDSDVRVIRIRQTLQRAEGQLQFLPPKTRRSRRTVPLPAIGLAALNLHRERQDAERAKAKDPWPANGLVFVTPIGTPIEPRNFTRMFQATSEAAGVPVARLHDLRHTCVSLLLSLGESPRTVMEIVGHSALDMTMNVYAHVALDMQRDALDRLNDLLDG